MAKHNKAAVVAVTAAVVEPGKHGTTALEAAPTAAMYLEALRLAYPMVEGKPQGKPYAPRPSLTLRVALTSAPQAKHGACAARHNAVTALLAKGPATVAELLATGYKMADVTWGLSPAHHGGAKLMVVE